MKIDIIVPSNNIEMINKFLKSLSRLGLDSDIYKIVIIGNGELYQKNIEYNNSLSIRFIRFEKEFDIIPFAELRGIGMIDSDCDFFLFLDDDHIFNINAKDTLNNSIEFLSNNQSIGILQLEKDNEEKDSFHFKYNAHIWTSRGLFIRNISFNYEEIFKLKGACEDLVYSYEVLSQGYLPYSRYNSGIERGCKLPNNYKELNNPSYNEKLLDDNCIGYIRNKYNDTNWKFYGSLSNLSYPNKLKGILE